MPKKRPPLPRPAPADADAIGSLLCDRVRALRKQKRWTLHEMSIASGVSRSMLSDIERGRANPTLVIAQRIALALGMSLSDLLEMPAAAPRLEIIRADDRTYHFRSDSRCGMRMLSPLGTQKGVEFYEIALGPGGGMRRAPHFRGTRELLTVRQGEVRVTAAAETAELRAGDSVHYAGDVEHAVENLGREEALLYQVVICPLDALGSEHMHPVRVCTAGNERPKGSKATFKRLPRKATP